MELKEIQNRQNNFAKEEQSWRTPTPQFQNLIQSCSNQGSLEPTLGYTYRLNKFDSPEINHNIYG